MRYYTHLYLSPRHKLKDDLAYDYLRLYLLSSPHLRSFTSGFCTQQEAIDKTRERYNELFEEASDRYLIDEETEQELEKIISNSVLMNECPIEDKFVVRKEYLYNDKSITRYYVFDSYKEFERYYNRLSEDNKTFHEILIPNRPRKVVFDIDGDQDNLAKVSKLIEKEEGITLVDEGIDCPLRLRIFETILSTIKKAFHDKYGYTLEDKDIIICDSSSDKKFSRHIIIKNYHFLNTQQASLFSATVASVNYAGGKPEFVCYDKGAGNKKFCGVRMTDSHKPESPERVKKIITDHSFRDTILSYIEEDSILLKPEEITLYAAHSSSMPKVIEDEIKTLLEKRVDMKAFSLRSSYGGIITYDRILPSNCPICNRVHESDGMFVTLYGNKVYLNCFGTSHEAHVGDIKETSIEIGKVNWPIPMLTAFDSIHGYNEKVEKIIAPELPNEMKYSEEKVREYSFNDGVNTLLIRSPIGSEKTKALSRYIDKAKPETIVMISCRRSFTDEITSRMPYLFDYRDIEGSIQLYEEPKVIIQYESLHRLGCQAPDLLILDESESILNQMSNPVLKKNSTLRLNFAKFEFLLRYSRKVIAMDAMMGDRTINLLTRTRTKKKILSHNNTYKPKVDSKVTIVRSKDQPHMIIRDLFGGSKIVLCSNTKRYAKKIEALVRKHFPDKKVKIHTGEDTAAERREQKDVNTNWDELDVLIYTSTITVGCSFEKKWYDRVYAFFTNRTVDVRTSIQMLGRVRDLSTKEYIIAFDSSVVPSDVPCSIKELEKFIVNYHKSLEAVRKSSYLRMLKNSLGDQLDEISYEYDENGKMDIIVRKDLYYYVHLYNTRERLESRNIYVKLMISYFIYQGYEIDVVFEPVKDDLIDTISKEAFELQIKEIMKPEPSEDNIILTHVSETLKGIESDMKEITREIREKEADEIASAKDLTDEEYKRLKEKQRLTKEESLSIEKKKLAKHYHIDLSKITSDFVLEYGDENTKRQYKRLNKLTNCNTVEESLEYVGILTAATGTRDESIIKLNTSKEYLRDKMIVDLMKVIGIFKDNMCNFEDLPSMSREELDSRLAENLPDYVNKYSKDIRICFHKRASRLKNPHEWTSRKSLMFVNSILGPSLGIRIKALDKSRISYQAKLHEKFTWDGKKYRPQLSLLGQSEDG